MSNNKPIGVFDSGVGGLTVVKELMRVLPDESIVYFGDTARVPYGTKSAKVVQSFALQDARFLLTHDVKLIVVACHTASSTAMDVLKSHIPVPALGVVEPGIAGALARTQNKHIGVIGTKATIHSETYIHQMNQADPDVQMETRACPLFVPLAEEGWLDHSVTELTAKEYLRPLREKGIDTLILGCTHYPLLKPVLRLVLGSSVAIVDSAEETARAVARCVEKNGLQNHSGKKSTYTFYVSDIPHQFRQIGERFLGCTLDDLHQVNLDDTDFHA